MIQNVNVHKKTKFLKVKLVISFNLLADKQVITVVARRKKTFIYTN